MSRTANPTYATDRLLYALALLCLISPALDSQQAAPPAQISPTQTSPAQISPTQISPAQQAEFINHAIYDVASIHKFKSDGGPMMMRWEMNKDGLTVTHQQIKPLIGMAYGMSNYQVLGAPDWVSSDFYDVQARMDEETMNTLNALPPEQAKLAQQHMMQALLAERCKLAVHHETKQFPIYKLVVGKGGAKLHAAKAGDDYANGLTGGDGKPGGKGMMRMDFDSGAMRMTAQGLSIDGLVQQLSGQLNSHVENDTGLKGDYDFTLRFTPENMRLLSSNASGGATVSLSDGGGISIFDALQEQLGLKLESQKGPLDVIVIDHIEQPSEN